MKFTHLAPLDTGEEKAEEYLRQRGVLVAYTKCPYCGSQNIGRVRRNMYKCYSCRHAGRSGQ